jgi:hypothetical protein
MLDVLARFGASLAAKDLAGRSVFDVCRSEVCPSQCQFKLWSPGRTEFAATPQSNLKGILSYRLVHWHWQPEPGVLVVPGCR